MDNRNHIFYIGLMPLTVETLSKQFHVVGVNELSFLSRLTLNPFNYLVTFTYFLRKKNRLRWLEMLSLLLSQVFFFFLSTSFRRFFSYIRHLSLKKIAVVDVEKIHETAKFIRKNQVELLVVNAWSLLPKEIIEAPLRGTVNLHPSLLPRYRGALPTLWALKNKDQDTALSIMLLDNKVDTGPVLKQIPFPIKPEASSIDLERQIDEIIQHELNPVVAGYLSGEIHGIQQRNVEVSATGKYEAYRKINNREETATEIYNKVLLYPYLEPGVFCYFDLEGKRIFLKKCYTLNRYVGKWHLLFLSFLIAIPCKEGKIYFRPFVDINCKQTFSFLKNIRKFSSL